MLNVENINAYYGDLQALWGISLQVKDGELVALVGPNGAGKTTTLRVITGLLKPASGTIHLDAESLTKDPPHKIVELGVSQVPEGGRIFTKMTVLENLELGAYGAQARRERPQTLKEVFSFFPRLDERQKQMAGTLSGGERQMLAIARALMSKPKLLLLDEPSFGLAPIMVQFMFDMIRQINQRGITILLVEQNVRAALELAGRAYVIENGRIVGQGTHQELLAYDSIRSAYLG